jgi:nucleoid-associated protein YgaU
MTAPSTPSSGAKAAATPADPPGEPAPDTIDTAAAPGAVPADDAMAAPATDRGGASEGMAEAASEIPPPAGVPTETEVATVSPSGEEAAAAPDTAAAEKAETVASGQPAEAEPPAVVEETPQAAPQVGIAAVEAETNGALYIAGTATTPEPVRVYVDEEFIGEAEPSESGTWLVEADREMAPAEYAIRADQVDTGTGAVIARAEVPFEREIVVATVTQTGETVDPGGAEVAGSVAGPTKVIIKRGDNLWRISREIYGRGIRYATIYRANRDQIRNPNLIYPGQVFILPTGDTAWESQ